MKTSIKRRTIFFIVLSYYVVCTVFILGLMIFSCFFVETAVITKSDIILAGICPLFTLIPGYIIYKVMKTNKKLGICLLILFFVLPAGLGIPTENTLDEIAKIIVLLSPVIIYLIWMYQKKNKKNHSTEIEQTENLLEEKL